METRQLHVNDKDCHRFHIKVCPMLYWVFDAPPMSRIRIENVEVFDARGMRRVYGRGDILGRKAAFNMDIWRDRSGNLFARFWSRNSEVDDLSFAIYGINADSIPERAKESAFSDAWIPKALRAEYENWVCAEG